jgi:hypothetical protein
VVKARLRKQLERRRRRRHASAYWAEKMKAPAMVDFPDDADGKALRQVAERADLARPMDVDFVIRVPDEAAAEAVAQAAEAAGYASDARPDDDDESRWCCYCTRLSFTLSYDSLKAAEHELTTLAAPFGGRLGGWGTFGNNA